MVRLIEALTALSVRFCVELNEIKQWRVAIAGGYFCDC